MNLDWSAAASCFINASVSGCGEREVGYAVVMETMSESVKGIEEFMSVLRRESSVTTEKGR